MDENIEVISCTALGAFGVKRAAYAVGVFDGVHLGHQMILSNLIRLAGQCGAEPVAVTFAPHPRALLTPQNPPKLLMPLSERIRKIHRCGIRFVVVMPFTRQLAVKSPEEFIQQSFMIENIQTAAITVGENWRFGAQGRGDGVFLRDFAQKHDFYYLDLNAFVKPSGSDGLHYSPESHKIMAEKIAEKIKQIPLSE